MKHRNGFVSNSSSSSFIFAVPKDVVLTEDLGWEETSSEFLANHYGPRLPKPILDWLREYEDEVTNIIYEVTLWYTKWNAFQMWAADCNVPYIKIAGPNRWGSIWSKEDYET